jgi:superfamily II DNA/RNA helicase
MAESGLSPSLPTFADLGVPLPLVEILSGLGITTPFPIQAATLPDSLAGRDVLGRGRTGSGKTYGFTIPMAARLAAANTRRTPLRPRALVLAPTRELATQIAVNLEPLATSLGLRVVTVFGGVKQGKQVDALHRGVDVVVACPGRLADLMNQGHADLSSVEITVLDEADHMADLGFLPTVRRLMDATPRDGQRMLFSATLDRDVDVLVKRFLHDPVTHSVDSASSPVATMSHHVLHVRAADRLPVLLDLAAAPGRTLVFTRTKHGAKRLAKQLNAGGVPAVELHGNLAQNARTRNLAAFSDGTASTMVATDIAARGIHVDGITLVVHSEPPVEHKAYLHRSGRTARAEESGTVVTLMTDEQVRDVRDLTRKAGVHATTTKAAPGHEVLHQLAPGSRAFVDPATSGVAVATTSTEGSGGSGSSGRSGGSRARGSRSRGSRSESARSGTRQGARSGGTSNSGGSAPRARGRGSSKRSAGGSSTAYSTSSSGGAATFSAGMRTR